MKADNNRGDLFGSAAADIANATTLRNELQELATKFGKIDKTKFEAIGLDLNIANGLYYAFICIDIAKSTKNKPYIVRIPVKGTVADFSMLFERCNVILYSSPSSEAAQLEYDERLEVAQLEYDERLEEDQN